MSNKTKRDTNGPSKSNKEIECCTCHRKLKNERFIQCLKCFNICQCLQCLSVGSSKPPVVDKISHNFAHSFVIYEPPSNPPRPFTRENWDQSEEVLLLYGVKSLGIGNWHCISDFVHTKSAIECEIHYIETYINSPYAPFPPNYPSISKSIIKKDKERTKQKPKDKDKIKSHNDKEKKKPKEEEKDADKKKKSGKTSSEISESASFDQKDQNSTDTQTVTSHHHHHSHHHETHHGPVEILPELPIPDPPAFDTRPVDSLPSEGNAVHLAEKQKKEATLPSEYSEYMPFRHEFDKDKDYEADGECLISDIHFGKQKDEEEEETFETFCEKVNRLQNYNRILDERRFRTKVVEEWDIHHMEVDQGPKNKHASLDQNSGRFSLEYANLPPNFDFAEFDSKVLGGRTIEDHDVDIKLISLGSYFKKDDVKTLSQLIHQRFTKQSMIKTRNNWQSLGVKALDEGQLFQALSDKIKDDKIIQSEIPDWNDRIRRYVDKHKDDKDMFAESLLQCEKELIAKFAIPYQLYMSFKNLLIREFTISRRLPRSKMEDIKNKFMIPEIEHVYDLCIKCGWIAP